ncbi:YfiR family protein, partial [Methylomonas sp. SURF-2]
MVLFEKGGLSTNLLVAVTRIALLISLSTGMARAEDSLEYKIKAAYLYNFTKFITWPALTGTSFNICLVGADSFQNLLDSLESRTVQDKPIRIVRHDNVKQIKNCQIVYFDNADGRIDNIIPNALSVASFSNSLTVSGQPLFAESGGMIGFVLEQERVKLHINLKVLKQSGLGISAKLIEVS